MNATASKFTKTRRPRKPRAPSEISSNPGEREGAEKAIGHEGESDLDLTPGSLEKTNDPVRMYLREMGTVPLLTREGEVDHREAHRARPACRDEVGHALADRHQGTIAVGDDLRKGGRSIKEIVMFDDEELTEEKIENKTKQTLKHIDKIGEDLRHRLEASASSSTKLRKRKKSSGCSAKWDVARTRIEISLRFAPSSSIRLRKSG